MPRIPTPEQDARRDEAFEMYRAGASLRKIAQNAGVTLSTVQWWRDKDGWAARADALMPTDSAAIGDLLRGGFSEAIQCLNQIIVSPTKEEGETRIRAILAYAKICKDLGVIRRGDLAKTPAALAAGFDDDLPITLRGNLPSPFDDEAGESHESAEDVGIMLASERRS